VRSVPAALLAFLLLLMLSVTTPTGTGDGVHSAVLLHPLFSHIHVVNGRIIVHQQFDNSAPSAPSSSGPSIGAEAGASAAVGLAMISPTLPFQDLRIQTSEMMRWPAYDALPPRGLVIAPPDPPPTLGV
jgi:hypothetical protein